MLRKILTLIAVLSFSIFNFGQQEKVHHEINATVNPAESYLEVEDEITIPENMLKGNLRFTLHHSLELKNETEGIQINKLNKQVVAKDVGIDRESVESFEKLALNEYRVEIPENHKGKLKIKVKYSGKIESPIEQSAENYARGFSQSPGIIAEKGVYLAGSTYWVPFFNDDLVTFNLDVNLPADWKSVSQGKRTIDKDENKTHADRWESPEPMEEVFLIAAKFTEYNKNVGAVNAMAFLRTPDESTANKYLNATAQYLEMYRQLIGPYPYTKFALVENFWETGYGMPSFTLLGEKIIRFPFIISSSYPHELLHNWWGNSVYVDFSKGNWCEGLTAYMADHLIKEQHGQGTDYRRSTLQKFTNFVNDENDFPLSKFHSRFDAPSEAIGYGKCLMMWDMLREKLGDESFIRSFQDFYRHNKFTFASFDDIRSSMEKVSGEDLKSFFDQWVKRKGAPELAVQNVSVKKGEDDFTLNFTLKQVQKEDAFSLDVPVFVFNKSGYAKEMVAMDKKKQDYHLKFKDEPLKIEIDPQYHLMRKLNFNEIPPALSKAFGSQKALIVLPSNADENQLKLYKELADRWLKEKPDKFTIKFDNEITEIPSGETVWFFGWKNNYTNVVNEGTNVYHTSIANDAVIFNKDTLTKDNNSFIITARNPENPESVIGWLTIGNPDAVAGLIRKLPHYGKYSYLAFEGDEPSNIQKGQWPVINSPLTKILSDKSDVEFAELPKREALAKLQPVFSADKMLEHVKFLASEKLKGRGLGTPELDTAAAYIANQFKLAGLVPAGDNGTFFQTWKQKAGKNGEEITMRNVVGMIPGNNPKHAGQSVIVSAHYDHLGLGWPDVHKGDEGKIHFGADDNASGVSVMIELAKLLAKTQKPARTIIFAAFTGEEEGLLGSNHFVKNMVIFPADKVMADINLDTVGRLNGKKIMILNGNTAREWKFIFMGAEYVTGIPIEMIKQPLDASDQVSFINAGIPAIQIFTGPNKDYHRPTDTADKIDADGMIKVATITKEAVDFLANDRDEPLSFPQKTEKKKEVKEQNKGGRKVSTGTMPDFAFEGEGVRIAEVFDDSPAKTAGLKAGDIIVGFDGNPVKDLRSYSDALKKHQPGDIVEIEYLRNGERKSTKLKLKAR